MLLQVPTYNISQSHTATMTFQLVVLSTVVRQIQHYRPDYIPSVYTFHESGSDKVVRQIQHYNVPSVYTFHESGSDKVVRQIQYYNVPSVYTFHESGSGPPAPATAATFKSAGYIEPAVMLGGRLAARSVPMGPRILWSSSAPSDSVHQVTTLYLHHNTTSLTHTHSLTVYNEPILRIF